MSKFGGGFGSPFLDSEVDHEANPANDEARPDWSPQLSQLLFESPFARLSLPEPAAEAMDEVEHECECDECCGGAHETEADGDDEETFTEPEFEAEDPPAPLSTDDRTWVLDIARSAMERLPDAALREQYLRGVDWKEVEFPDHGNGSTEVRAHWKLAEALFLAMAQVTPERRVPSGNTRIRFHVPQVQPVPGQKEHKLFPEAAEVFVRMREAAAAEGVKLVITSSFRSAKRQADLSASHPNAKAVARGTSAHMYGLAIDLGMAVKGLDFSGKSYTNSPEKMAKLVRMYRSPTYKWMMLRGRAFGWYPYRREPWHWEYNPPGFKARFEGNAGASSASPASSTSTPQPAELVRFAQRVLNAAEGEKLSDDGDPGRLTRAAIERFRTKYQLGAGSALDTRTALALVQRALEEIAQASMFARTGTSDATTDQAIAAFRAQHGLGFGAVLDAATRRALTEALAARRTATPSSPTRPAPAPAPVASRLGGKLLTFQAQTLGTRVAVYCPPAAAGQAQVDVLVYAHGLLNGCKRPKSLPDGMVTDSPFKLGALVDASQRPIVLVVPLLDWDAPGGTGAFGKVHPRWNALAHPQNLNALVGEVIAELSRVQSGATSTLGSLVVAGHSRAYDFLEPLAALRDDPQMRQGALARLSEVWAFDTTYGGDVDRWKAWLAAQPGLQAHFFYRPNTRTESVGYGFYQRRGNRLFVTQCNEGHCAVPAKRLPALLRGLTADHEVADELEFEGEFEGEEAYAFDEEGVSEELLFEAGGEDEFEDMLLSDDFIDEDGEESDGGDEGEFENLFDAEEDGADEEAEFEFDEEDAAEAETELEDEVPDTAPLQLPSDSPVPFAPEPGNGSYWPVKTKHKEARVVSYQSRKGVTGRSGRMFMAARHGKRGGKTVDRRHVGVDLFAYPNDEVVACEAGTIVAFGHFYKAKSGQDTYKLMIEHDGSKVVCNYGEVRSDSLSRHGLAVGSRVAAGQPIGFVSDTSMIHFEAYVKGSTTTQRWWKDEKKAPLSLLNPTPYLLFLRDHGLVPGSGAVPVAPPAAPISTGSGTGAAAKPTAEMVRFAQRVLNAVQGARLSDDGQLGRLSQAAITRFREDHNLGAGGLDNTAQLALAQRALEELAQQSMFSQPGQLDDRTKQALVDFRSRHGLGADARLDAATRSALTDALAQRARAAPAATPVTSSTGNQAARPAGVTPPSDPSAYRQFRLTTYHVVDQADEPTGAVRIPIVDVKGDKLAEGSPAFFAKLSLEGTGRLTDGRLVNVTGKTVAVRHADYADVLAHHDKAYAKGNEKRAKQGRKPVSTQYSGITVSGGQVVKAFAFHIVEPAKRGLGYGMARGVAYEPFRTLAADIGTTKYANVEPRWKGKGGLVPPGTRVYIREYDGLQIPGIGRHDGWFIVNDTGGAIFGAHFDVFTGSDALRKQVKVPAVGHVWFDGIEGRIPAGYTYGLSK